MKQMSNGLHVMINPEHRSYFLRFLRFLENNLNGQICEYRTNFHLFHAVWLFVRHQFWPQLTAESGQDQFGQEAANFPKNDFYVDDRLKTAIDVIRNKQLLCTSVNLNCGSNGNKNLLEAMPIEDHCN